MPTYEISFFQPKYKEETAAGRKICLLLDHLSHKVVFLCQERCKTNTIASCIKTAPCNIPISATKFIDFCTYKFHKSCASIYFFFMGNLR